MKDEDHEMRRIGMGLVIISAFVMALCIYAMWSWWGGGAP